MAHPLTAAMDSLRRPPVMYLANCWRILRTDGVEILLTDADGPLTLADGKTYLPNGSADASARRKETELESQTVEVLGVLTSDRITSADLRAGKYRDARVDVRLVDRRFPWQGHFQHQRYWMRPPRFDSEIWSVDLEGFGKRLERQVGSSASVSCGHELGQGFELGTADGCQVDLTGGFTVFGRSVVWVDSDNPKTSFRLDYDSPNADGHFALGKVIWLSGSNAGTFSRVRTDAKEDTDKARIFLLLETLYAVEVGDVCDLVLGCNKLAGVADGDTVGHCKNRYGGGAIRPEFDGDPFIPGSGKVLRRPL